MKTLLPAIHGTIDRRILINYRVHPAVIHPLLPASFRPKLVNGWAIAGICLIRLKAIRPQGFPSFCGLNSENAAHRIAVEWNEAGAVREGVFIVRRDTSSMLQVIAGTRVFPGVHHGARFTVRETGDHFSLQMRSRDTTTWINLQVRRALQMPPASVFNELSEASDFFAHGSIGYSPAGNPHCCDGLELHTQQWHVSALEIQQAQSSLFDDTTRFPAGTIQLDSALLMENIEHQWRVLPRLRTSL